MDIDNASKGLAGLFRRQAAASSRKAEALAMLEAGVKSLRHLVRISKGEGKPTLTEISNLHSAALAAIAASAEEAQMAASASYSVALSVEVELSALLSALKSKGIVTEEEQKAGVDKIIEEKKAAVAKAKEEALKRSVAQAKGEQLPPPPPAPPPAAESK